MLFEGKSMCNINAIEVVSSEKRNKHILKNPDGKEVFKYHIDGDIIDDANTQRCDYLVEINSNGCLIAFVIELKGSGLTKAIKQIESTIAIFKEKLNIYMICPRIVIHRVSTHDINSSVYRKFKKQYPDFKTGTEVVIDTA